MNKLPMTTIGHLALENELTHRIRVERPRLIQRIQDAIADDTNLAENSEYQAAKTEQELNEARIGELEDKLARAEIINIAKLSGDTVKFGATVTLIEEETGEKKIWQIVGEPEADAHKGKISIASPIARALIGKSKGGNDRGQSSRRRRSLPIPLPCEDVGLRFTLFDYPGHARQSRAFAGVAVFLQYWPVKS